MGQTPKASRPVAPDCGIVGEDAGEGLLPWSWATERLAKTRNYYLATGRPDGRPHLMPIWGVWLDDAFYFSTGKDSVKGKNLAANPRCVVATEDPAEAVIVEGTVSLLDRGPTFDRFVVAYREKYGTDMSTFGQPVYVVAPRVAFGQIEKTFTQSATRWAFEPTAARAPG
jgi:pyridoxine/pyridoxamine 5'-phosphate oxidase